MLVYSLTEKKITRAALKSEFEKHCGISGAESKLATLDIINYIKGYMYELYCFTKACHQKHVVIWILLLPDIEIQWNNDR